jgi:hypothetical protein
MPAAPYWHLSLQKSTGKSYLCWTHSIMYIQDRNSIHSFYNENFMKCIDLYPNKPSAG